jgi:uncharacterized protein (TIGR02246 family)
MSEKEAITEMLLRYQDALNGSDVDGVMKLYAVDGVFMPQNDESSVGAGAVRKAYESVFGSIQLTVKFVVAEVVAITADWAFARTNSKGSVMVRANGATLAEANQELFVLQRIESEWKIARYCFATTLPPRG